jgi:glycosyltransferase involved in cell wall biosynthesis
MDTSNSVIDRSRMNLLFITAEYPPERCGGIGVFYQDLARQLARRGNRVTVVAPSGGNVADTFEGPLTVRRWPGSLTAANAAGMLIQRMRFTRFAQAVARDVAPDLIETHEWSGPLSATPGRPFVVRLHGAHAVMRARNNRRPSAPIRLLERRLIRSADAVVAVSNWVARETARVLGIARPITAIPNGIDTTNFRPSPAPCLEQELLFVGTVKPEKGVFELFRALPLILERCPASTVRIVGPQTSDSAARLLASIPAALRVRIRFDGSVERDRLPAIYSAATLCAVPSMTEAFGLTMAEAMSCGIPVVGSSLCAGPELAQHGRDALLVDPRDTGALASAALECLADAALRERLSIGARLQALRGFSWDVVAEQNRQFYVQVIEGARKWRKSA